MGQMLGLLVALEGGVTWAQQPDAHVLAGARAFRAGEWADALVEFRVALKRGAPPSVHWYEGATLARAGRFEEAVGAFQLALELAPAERDPLLDYYRALACFETHLWGCVAEVTAELERTGGPRIQQQVASMASEAKQLLAREPPHEAIDACFSRASAASSAPVARAWLREAARLGRRRADGWRVEEADRAAAARLK
jgi:tetratricopeptide (TPR) repeat protein